MELKYIYNELGEKESVIVPIQQWENKDILPKKYGTDDRIDALNKLKESFKKVPTGELIAEIEKNRSEWERNF